MAQINTNRFRVSLLDESAWGDEGAGGNEELIPVLDGDYNVALEDPVREQQHVNGDADSFYAVQDVRNLRGSLKAGIWPHLTQRILDLALSRTAGELDSVAAYFVIPGIETRVHAGLKVDSITIDGQQGGDVMVSLDFIGRHETTVSEPSYPGSYVIPAIPSLTFKNCRILLSLDSDGDMENAFLATGASQFSITVNNNIKNGPPVEDRETLAEDGVPAFLIPGRVNGEFRCTAVFDRAAFGTLQRNRLYAQLKVLAAHPSYATSFVVDTGGATAGTSVTVPVTADPSSDIAVGDVVYFDAKGGGLPCVGVVEAVTTTDIDIAVLDENVTAGDNIYLAALELKTAYGRVSATPLNTPFDDFITVEVRGQMFSGGASPLTYKVKDMTLPA